MVHCVVALTCEARPLIEARGLQPLPSRDGFRIYEGEGLRIIVSGVGKIAAAAATTALQAHAGNPEHVAWLNVGIAGHAELAVGTPIMADAVVDTDTGKSYQPDFNATAPCVRTAVHTVDRPVDTYPERVAYDMEASGFFATATRYAPLSLVHCLKIISDNREAPARKITAAEATSLITAALDLIETVITTLDEHSQTWHLRQS